MWILSLPWWQFLVRAGIIYVFLILILRFTGKRQIGQMEPFDLVLLLILSNAVQNSMNGGDNSVTAGMLLALTLVALNYATGLVIFRSKRAEAFVEGKPVVLIHNGRVYEDSLRQEKVTRHELIAALRDAGCAGPEDVHYAILETNGHISVHPRKPAPPGGELRIEN